MTTEEKQKPKSTLCRNLLGHFRLDIGCSLDQVRDNLVTMLLASSLNLLQLRLGLHIRLVLGLLESARVLEKRQLSIHGGSQKGTAFHRYSALDPLGVGLTSASNFLYSSSLWLRYSSISF